MHDQHYFIIAAVIRQDFMPWFWLVSEGKRLWKDVHSFAITRMMRKGEIEQCFSPSRQTRTWQETEVSTGVYAGAKLLKLKLLTNASICEIFAFLTWNLHEPSCALCACPELLCFEKLGLSIIKNLARAGLWSLEKPNLISVSQTRWVYQQQPHNLWLT